MKVITSAMGKGGVGKTTNTLALAFSAAARGLNTLLVDFDNQANLTASLRDPESLEGVQNAYDLVASDATIEPLAIRENLSLIPAAQALTQLDREDFDVFFRLRERLHDLYASRYDVVIIDTPGNLGTRVIAALVAADGAFTPIELTAYSVQTLEPLYQLIQKVKQRFNPSLEFLGLLPNRIGGLGTDERGQPIPTISTERQVYLELVAALGEEMILGLVAQRKVIKDALSSGRPLTDMPKDDSSRRAIAELEGFADTVFRRLGVKLKQAA
jgi:chromosome partitioning protein